MFTPGGQIDLLSFAGLRGGGKGGGGYAPQEPPHYAPLPPIIYTDPVTGKVYTQQVDQTTGQPLGESAQDMLNRDIDARKAQEKADSEAAAEKKRQEEAAARAAFETRKQTAYDDAFGTVKRQFTQQGVDPTQYLESDINPELQRMLHSIKDMDVNPESAFSPDLGTTIINRLTSGKRTNAANALDKLFTPTYASTALPDTLTSQYAPQLIDEQFSPLGQQLLTSMKRGTLTDRGYTGALSALEQKRSGALANINELGSGILSRERGDIDTRIGKARTDANALNLATDFNPGTYETDIRGLVDKDIADFGGALRNAVGGTKYASLGELINLGGSVQGVSNTKQNNLSGADPLTGLEPEKKRGLGSTGAF